MTGFDTKNRELCPDGACIGVIGSDGRCKECGKQAPGKRAGKHAGPAEAEEADEDDFDEGSDEGDTDEDTDEDDFDEDDSDEDDFDEDDSDEDDSEDEGSSDRDDDAFSSAGRELCSDDMCVGVIGPNGTCKECGRPGASRALNPRTRGLRTEEEVAEQLETNIATSDLAEAPESFEERLLCPDGGCVGVIGPDGRCTECGALADRDD